ncbi:hypothetical protein RhiirC2_771791 [Rhizophagus irregularis]|uniref:Uncharacterized protein n=1 Tax=Rhizophagus irregularis TaxID=588596 RepID=A0A2N1NSY1_9GLOM|nr:hypothetical protein RhiirC2_771791 [Rhizophagus irregularis]
MDDNELNDDLSEYSYYRNVESIEESLSGSPKFALLAIIISKRSSFLESTTSSQQTKKSSSPLPALGWHFGRSYIHILNSAPSSILMLYLYK